MLDFYSPTDLHVLASALRADSNIYSVITEVEALHQPNQWHNDIVLQQMMMRSAVNDIINHTSNLERNITTSVPLR